MELVIAKDEFVAGLSRVQSVIERRTTLPILSNVLLDAQKGGLMIVGTDLEVGLKGLYEAQVKKTGSITVASKKLFEIVRELPPGEVRLKLEDGDRVNIQAGKADFHILGLATDEYPILPDYKDEEFAKFPAADLSEMLEKVSGSIGQDETRVYLNGVYLETSDNGGKPVLRAVATDGHRLSLCERPLPDGSKLKVSPGVIVPKKGVGELRKALDGLDGDIEIAFPERNLVVRAGGVLYIIRLIDGQFPEYGAVIPAGNNRVLTASRDELVSVLRRVALLSEELGRGVKFSLDKKILELSCENPNLGKASEEMAVTYDGEAFEIGFNARYFQDALGVVRDEDVNLAFNDAFSPVLIKSPSDPGFKAVIMPMRL
ncbi:MAG: DNA polymerase III subunit beta [Deltaproteobacteria bacterium]|nr:DNA polymerase III subunit beta [Deltaproteobacteria bacterium]MCB9489974.1 DNA polymerase III subunit beta [Deltaproteobacteria bacterium]